MSQRSRVLRLGGRGRSPSARLFQGAALAAALAAGAARADEANLSVIPAPLHAATHPGAFRLVAGAVIAPAAGDPQAKAVAVYLQELLRRTRGLDETVRPGASGAVRLRLDPSAPAGEEAYSLRVTPTGVEIAARRPAGLFYGAVTLWQLATADGGRGAAALPVADVEDAPRFAWRGLMLDSARHFQSPAFVEKFIDVMALHKLNVLQWHLADDQGWRLEIKAYPKLTSVGAWRTPAGADGRDARGRTRRYGGFYTQAQVREIVAYAAARHVTIVPEIELPGHATTAIAAYPELSSVAGTPREPSSDWGVLPNLYAPDDRTFAFLERVLTEVMTLFPSPYIHVGGDEAVKDQWKASSAVQAKIKALGLKDEDALQGWFIARIGRLLNAHGRRLVGWDEILEGGGDLPPGAVVTSWHGLAGAATAAKAGHDAVLAPGTPLYLDNRNGGGPEEPPGRGLIFTLKDVYGFDPRPPGLTDAEQAHVLGLQAQLWSEHIRTEPRMEWMAFPRASAVAEIGWSPSVGRSWPDFASRMPAQMARYRALGVNAATSPITPTPVAQPPLRRASQELKLCSDRGTLNLEDDAPHDGPRAVFLVDILNPCWRWPNADLSHGREIAVGVGQLPFNFQFGSDAPKVPMPPPATPEGELVIRDGCEGERLAVVPLAQAAANPAVTTLHATLSPRARPADLCFTFTRAKLDPFWAVDFVQLSPVP